MGTDPGLMAKLEAKSKMGVRNGEPVWLQDCWADVPAPTYELGNEAMDFARLAAAAPALVRALLAVEWDDYEGCPCCPSCNEARDGNGHDSGACPVDAALTRAGFPDAASRDAARARMAEK